MNVDKDIWLTGFCDYILSASEEQLYLEAPVVTIIEAKNENIISGLGQCIAAMYAAQLFNQQSGYNFNCMYGAVTIGNEWRFIKLQAMLTYIDNVVYYMNDIKKIIGILVAMASQ